MLRTLPGGAHVTVSLPAGKAPEAPAPLVVSLHYGGPVSPGYGAGLLEQVVEPGLSELGAVMVAPDCDCDRWADAPCVTAVEQAIAFAEDEYSIDTSRRVLCGYSKGGIGTWALAAVLEGWFSAAIVMAGRPPEPLDAERWKTPVYVIQAGADELFPVAPSEVGVAALAAAGVNAELEVLDGVTHFETYRFAAPLGKAVPWLRDVWNR